MGKEVIELLVEGGNAKPGPNIGPKLSQLKLNVGEVISKINEATKEFKGLQVPVKIIVDTETRKYEIEVGLPPTSSLLKREANIEVAKRTKPDEVVGNVTMEQIIKVAKMKMKDLNTTNLKSAVKMVLGTALSMGLTVNNRNPKELIKEVDQGLYDNLLK
ncbi:50S ribosomal protein L11 [Candidatus Nanobsidianus stetteri]|jgi:large subunit ribosomal protein L11|uniref:Large ribosomal subunit protein uL11 n=1 Tax=Nanobsidianus stetteri TaxID=1294122 RepID=A0A2T9WLR4_NANST|nr:50S ribosomal protein L11 [Candidatus Nanobsidianus stetteri]MCC5447013.1 50S ribosomal protein L11 [Candidatus Nanobsidianus stetteri]